MNCNHRGFCITQGNAMKLKVLFKALFPSKRMLNFKMWIELRYTILSASLTCLPSQAFVCNEYMEFSRALVYVNVPGY
jgi:Fe-S oxidoreductase